MKRGTSFGGSEIALLRWDENRKKGFEFSPVKSVQHKETELKKVFAPVFSQSYRVRSRGRSRPQFPHGYAYNLADSFLFQRVGHGAAAHPTIDRGDCDVGFLCHLANLLRANVVRECVHVLNECHFSA